MFDKIKKYLLFDEDEMLVEEQQISTKSAREEKKMKKKASDYMVDGDVIITEPLSYSESQSIADCIKAEHSVIVNLHRVTPDQAKRIIDFISGTVYALDGTIKRIGDEIFYVAPKSVNITGDINEQELSREL